MSIRSSLAFPVSCALAAWLSSCGAGTAAIFGASDDGGGTTNSAPALTGFAVLGARAPETCSVRFVLADAESDRADVALFYKLAGGVPRPLEQVSAVQLTGLATAPQGLVHSFAWSFASESGLPDDASYVPGVRVYAQLAGVSAEADLDTNAALVALGNDAPGLAVDEPTAPEQTGIVPQRFTLSDSASDFVSVRVEYDVVGDDPDLSWRAARPGGVEGEATPDPAIAGVETSPEGVELVFFWDTQFDLGDVDRDVRLQFTALDDWDAAEPEPSASFRIDNNSPPIASIGEAELLLNPDGTRGIPIPYEVFDEEGDEVRVVFQWRGPDESYPELPESRDEIEAILADPVARRQHRICTPYPSYLGGQAIVLDSTHVRLPELASTASTLVARGIVGREIEFLRPANRFEDVTESWDSNPLQHPVAALPTVSGIAALVLDLPAPGSWRLRELELSTGEVLRSIANSNAGTPTVMDWERGGNAVLVASDMGGEWTLERVSLDGSGPQWLFTWDGTVEEGPIRGLASLGKNAALVTVGSSLVRVDWTDPNSPFAATLLADLAEPWGLALDPLNEGRVYLAERTAKVEGGLGRVLSIDLDLHDKRRVIALEAPWSAPGLPRPRSIALEQDGARLLALCEPPGSAGTLELRGVGIGRSSGTEAFMLAAPSAGSTSIEAGADRTRILAQPSPARLLIAGGVCARRSIASHVAATSDVTLSEPAPHPASCCMPWRSPAAESVRTVFRAGLFVWDVRDATNKTNNLVLIRQLAYDTELGIESEVCCAQPVSRRFTRGVPLDANGPVRILSADLDGDGDFDLASANTFGSDLTVFWQSSPGVHDPEPLVLGGVGITDAPNSIAAADLDGDGDLDLASANGGNDMTVFWQSSPGVYDPEPLVLGGVGVTDAPNSIAAADLDGDGDLDLASANGFDGNDLTVFWQSSPGVYDPDPLVLGGFGVTDLPTSITAADFDGDGDLDLASANLSDGGDLTIFWQSSPGTYHPEPLVLGGEGVTDGPGSITAADLDGDGDVDLASANLLGSDLTVFWQSSPGVYDPDPLVLGGFGVTDSPTSITAADFDGDGDLDLASANFFDGGDLTIFWQISPASYHPNPLVLGGVGVTDYPTSITAADIDGDGDLDLGSSNLFYSGLLVFWQRSSGTFDPEPVILGGPDHIDGPTSIIAADLDGDGDFDLASANGYGSSDLSVFWQTSPSVFDPAPLVVGRQGLLEGPASITAADLDGDGDLDLGSANADDLTVFWQMSRGAFDPEPLVLGGKGLTDSPNSITAADLDGDGDFDLASANVLGNNLTVFWQTQSGIFDPEPLVLGGAGVTDSPNSITAADLDGDGDGDLASTNPGAAVLTIFWQSSPGVFDPEPLVLGGVGVTDAPNSITAADLDGDGDLDLASVNAFGDYLTVFWQGAPGAFDPAPLVIGGVGVTDRPVSITAADLDGDGDLDLGSANLIGSDLTVFWQSSPGTFNPEPLVLGGLGLTGGPGSITAADVDGDGDVDLASANGVSDDLTIFWGGQ